MVARRGLADQYEIASAGTSTEELGNDMHPGAKKKLDEMGIPYEPRKAVQLTREDGREYDYLFFMDEKNIINAHKIIGNRSNAIMKKLIDFNNLDGDISDPWYTGDFEATFNDIDLGCRTLFLKFLMDDRTRNQST
jgi:protein-tyrosine phosphatase